MEKQRRKRKRIILVPVDFGLTERLGHWVIDPLIFERIKNSEQKPTAQYHPLVAVLLR